MSSPTKGKPKQPERRPAPAAVNAGNNGSGNGAALGAGGDAPTDPPDNTPSGKNPQPGNDTRARVTAAARSDKGRVRPDNQDNLCIMPLEVRTAAEANAPANLITCPDTRYVIANRGVLLAVFDGMGGVAGGQWAASEASRVVGSALFERRRELKSDTKPGEEPEKLLEAVLHTANERIHQHGYQKPEWMGMGSTATTAWVIGKRMVVGQVGDSRTYMYHDGQLIQVTRDQTLVNALQAAGVLTAEQAAVHPRRTELLECLGPSAEVRPELYEVQLPAKCRILLCSDGLHGPVTNDRIKEILAQPKLPGEICRQLIDAANARGGHDNITAIVADLEVPDGPAAPKIRRLTSGDALLGYLDEQQAAEADSEPSVELDAAEHESAEEADAGAAQPMGMWMWAVLGVLVCLVVLFSVLVVKEYLDKQAARENAAPAPAAHSEAAPSEK